MMHGNSNIKLVYLLFSGRKKNEFTDKKVWQQKYKGVELPREVLDVLQDDITVYEMPIGYL
jgi:hypothetical protein